MKSTKTVEEYIKSIRNEEEISILKEIRNIILKNGELIETIKWGIPCYTYEGKNILGIAVFKDFTSIWFYHGALLDDHANVLINAQEGKTKALRQWRFKSMEEFDPHLVVQYINQAIALAKSHKFFVFDKEKQTKSSPILHDALKLDSVLHSTFEKLPSYKQEEYHEYLLEAKRESTKQNRLNKIIPLIKSGKGLNDKYRK